MISAYQKEELEEQRDIAQGFHVRRGPSARPASSATGAPGRPKRPTDARQRDADNRDAAACSAGRRRKRARRYCRTARSAIGALAGSPFRLRARGSRSPVEMFRFSRLSTVLSASHANSRHDGADRENLDRKRLRAPTVASARECAEIHRAGAAYISPPSLSRARSGRAPDPAATLPRHCVRTSRRSFRPPRWRYRPRPRRDRALRRTPA